jgi:hypothetical protein
MQKFEVRAESTITFDFEVEAADAIEAEEKIEEYFKYVEGGRAEGQKIRIDTAPGCKLTHVFVTVTTVEDVNEAD